MICPRCEKKVNGVHTCLKKREEKEQAGAASSSEEATPSGAEFPQRHASPASSLRVLREAQIEAAARALWKMGNARIGERSWESVAAHYIAEATVALEAALASSEPAKEPEPKSLHGDCGDWLK